MAERDALAAKLAEATAFAVTEQRERLAVEEKLRVATEALRCDSCGSTVWECDRCANRTEFAATAALAGEKEGK